MPSELPETAMRMNAYYYSFEPTGYAWALETCIATLPTPEAS